MGEITDIGNDAIKDKIMLAIDTDPAIYFMNIRAIQEYVNDVYYDYFTIIEQMSDGWSQEVAAVSIRIQHDILGSILEGIRQEMDTKLSRVLHLQGSFWNTVVNVLGLSYNESSSEYTIIADGFINRTKVRLTNLEAAEDVFTPEQISKLNWLIDHYDDFNKLITDDINYVINEVMNRVQPIINSAVTSATAPYNARLTAVEQSLNKTQFWFWDILLDVWAFLAGGSILPIGQIEDAMITIGEWFIDEIFEITDPIKSSISLLEFDLGNRIADVEGLVDDILFSYAEHLLNYTSEVNDIVDEKIAAALTGIGGGTGEKGEKGEPGARGEKGEPGAPGEPGTVGDVNVNDINEKLYTKLWNASAITTSTFTGVVDWMLETYGLRFADIQEQITPITEFFTDETKTALTELVDKFGSPEAIVSFLIPESEGQEVEVLDLMQILISMTFERSN